MTDASQPLGLPPETIFGHLKKLHFFLDELSTLSANRTNNLKVLDFGCGNTEAIGRYIAKVGYDYYGVDVHKESLDHAKKLTSGLNVHLLESIPDGTVFDAILYGDVLEHLENPESIIKEHIKQLAPDGIIIGAVPNGFGPFEIESALDSRFGLTRQFQSIRQYYYAKRHAIAVWIKTVLLQRDLRPSPPLSEPIPFNVESGHIQFFKWSDLQSLFDRCNLKLVRFEKGVFMGGPFSGSLIGGCKILLKLNDKLGQILPRHMVSSWYFSVKINQE